MAVKSPSRARRPLVRPIQSFEKSLADVTRGKRLVVLVGQKKAVAIAVRNVSGRRRWSKLAEWLSADDSKRYGAGYSAMSRSFWTIRLVSERKGQ
jgi:hypothetical protein